MANDIQDPGPNKEYPYFPRDSNGFPMKHMDKVTKAAGKDTHGKTIYIDVTPRASNGKPISEVAPRITKQPGNGITKLTEWATAGDRTETFKVTAPNGDEMHIVRNIETGEQAEI